MLTKCTICGSYDVEFYETLAASYYCDECFRSQDWYETCLNTTFDTSDGQWCSNGYWVESES